MRPYWLIPIATAICLTSVAGAKNDLKGKQSEAKLKNRQFVATPCETETGLAKEIEVIKQSNLHIKADLMAVLTEIAQLKTLIQSQAQQPGVPNFKRR